MAQAAELIAGEVVRAPEPNVLATSTAASQRVGTRRLQRKCACGGGCEECAQRTRAPRIQPKVPVGAPDDLFEREADGVAARVMRMSGAPPDIGASRPAIQRAALPDQAGSAAGAGETPLSSFELMAGGAPLPAPVRGYFEAHFGRDFSSVRVHSGALAEDANESLRSHAFTYGSHVWLGRGQNAGANALLAHELAHVVQQTAPSQIAGPAGPASSTAHAPRTSGAVIQRQPQPQPQAQPQSQPQAKSGAPAPSRPRGLEVEVVGVDARIDESISVMADRWARDRGGRVIRVKSIEDMIGQIEGLVKGTCLGRLVVWYHGSPEIQLLVGEYELPPSGHRLPASGFSRQWLALERNRPALNRFRRLFCCYGSMQWIGCGTATVRASGGLRTREEMAREPALLQAYPDIYRSAAEAQAHGATLRGASFGQMNVQAWADATCTTIRSATNLVTLQPKAPNPVTIDNGGQWVDVAPQVQCACDPATGRVAGTAPSREEMVKSWQKQTAALVGQKNVLWHQAVLLLRTGVPHVTEIVGASASQGGRSLEPRWGSLPWALREEMRERIKTNGKRGPLESFYAINVLFSLLRMAGADIVPPAPLPKLPMPDHLHVRISGGGTWAAVTQRHLAVVNRNDFWHWTIYNDRAIGETPEFTRTVIEHELEHAADYERDLRDFEKLNPRPTTAIPDQYFKGAEEKTVYSWKDDWGKYINAFIAFQVSRTKPERHFEIVLGQRSKPVTPGGASSFDRWSAGERLYWFDLAFRNLPPNVASGTPLPGEDQVLDAFKAADPALKRAVVLRAVERIQEAMQPDPKLSPAEVKDRRAVARTLVQHFDPIIERVLRNEEMERLQMTRGVILSILKV